MIGSEFETARLHLLEHLDGNIAWKDPQQAQRQKERMQMKKDKERELRENPSAEPTDQPDERQMNNENVEEVEDENLGFSISM